MCSLFSRQICHWICVLSFNVYIPSKGVGNLSQALIVSCCWCRAVSSRRGEPPSWSHLHSSLLSLATIAWMCLLCVRVQTFWAVGWYVAIQSLAGCAPFIWSDDELRSLVYPTPLSPSPTNGQLTKELLVCWNRWWCLDKSRWEVSRC